MLLRTALRKKSLKLTALMTAVTLAVAPPAAQAQENKGPPVLRDTETENLLREYTRPILRTAGMAAYASLCGFGIDGYRLAINGLATRLGAKASN